LDQNGLRRVLDIIQFLWVTYTNRLPEEQGIHWCTMSATWFSGTQTSTSKSYGHGFCRPRSPT